MRVQTSKALIAAPHPEGWVVFNFLKKSAAICSPDTLLLLQELHEWTSIDNSVEAVRVNGSGVASEQILPLLDSHFLVVEGSQDSELEAQFVEKWQWGAAAAALHFSTVNCEFMSLEDSAAEQLERLQHSPQPDLVKRNGPSAIALPRPQASLEHARLLPTMLQRRTNRVPLRQPITMQQLADCLYAGLAITGSVQTDVSTLPLSITPSGGARNPYEGYVYAQSVEGLKKGFYHYSGVEHSLELVSDVVGGNAAIMLGGQDWPDHMPAIIFLVAHFERTMWKYQDANAYRVTLIEAGHIGQNIMLAATAHGLSACPTAALHHETISRNLGLDDMLHAPVYAITLSLPLVQESS